MYIGPFKVIRVVGCNVLKLDLPVVLLVHPVFNVLLIQRCTGDRMLPAPLAIDDEMEYVIDCIIWHGSRPRHF